MFIALYSYAMGYRFARPHIVFRVFSNDMNILFVTSNRIGDAVLSTGLLGYLLDQHPDARFTIACGPAAAGLFKAFPNLENLHVMRKRKRAGHWRDLWKAVIGTRWDIVVDLRGSGLTWMLWAKKRYRSKPDNRLDHKVFHLARVMGLEANPPAPRLWFNEADAALLNQYCATDKPLIVLGPTANWGGKQWPGARFANVVRRLRDQHPALKDAAIMVLGGPGEESSAAACLDALAGLSVTNLVGKASLGEVAAILSRATLYIGNDSGLMHMAAASGVPTLGLFGPSRHEHYAPWGADTAWVRTPESLDEIVSAPGYDFTRQDSHMASLTEDTVLTAANSLLDKVAQQAG